jgi:hypothetical protein
MPFPPSVSGKTGGYDGLVPSVTVAVFVFPSRRYVSLTGRRGSSRRSRRSDCDAFLTAVPSIAVITSLV